MSKLLSISACAMFFFISASAQVTGTKPCDASRETVVPYKIEVCYDKTLHILFPTAIVYVDLGSRDIIADKAGDAENVLRVKAARKGFESQTNLSVITDNGDFYTFDVRYADNPSASGIEMRSCLDSKRERRPNNTVDVLLRELGEESPRSVYTVMNAIYVRDEHRINHIGGKGFGIKFLLCGLYSHNGVLYLHTRIRNDSNIRYGIDFIAFKIVDKKIARRTAIQERTISPLRTYNDIDIVESRQSEHTVYAFEMFTIPDDKCLVAELRERNGGRHLSFRIENGDIVQAKVIGNVETE